MPGEDIVTTMQWQADITDFKASMQEANRAIKLANSEFKAASSGMDDWSGSTDGLTAKLKQLSTLQDAQRRKLDALNMAYQQAVEEQGENSRAAQELRIQINNQQAVVNATAKDIRKYEAALADVESSASGAASDVKKAGDAAKKAGDDAKDGSDGWSIMKDVIADFVSNTISSAIDALATLAESTREYRRDMAQLSQNASDAGHDMAAMKDTLKDVASVTGETDAAMEGLNMLMATGMNTENLTNAAEAFAGAATRFDGLKFEGMAEGLQESLAVGEAVGPFAELIERTGGNLEAFNEGMAACTTQAEKQQYAMQWLNESGLQGVHDAYIQNNADLVAAEEAQFRYNESLARVGAAIEPINTALSTMGAIILEDVAPIVENIVQWVLDNGPLIEPIVIGIATALGVLAAALAIQGIINGVSKAFALLNTTMLANPIVLIVAAIAGLVAAFVTLWNKSEAFRDFWKNMWEGIKEAFAATVEWLGNAAASIGSFFSNAWNSIKAAWSKAGSWFSGIWDKIKGAFSSVGSWFGSIFRSAWQSITNAFSNVSSFFSGIWGKIKGAFSDAVSGMASIGSDIVRGLWNGINDMVGWISGKIQSFGDSVLSGIKSFFGIASPSKVMRDEVGKMLGLGMAEGIQQSRGAVQGAMRGLGEATLGGLPSGVSGAAPAVAGGKTIVFNQTNNSPRALSRREIYRKTYNALAYAGGV